MAKYAHIKDGAVYKRHDFTAEQIAEIPAHKAHYILPVIEVAEPAYDPLTHYAPVALDPAINANDVTYDWAAPVAKTQQEIDGELAVVQDNAMEDVTRDNAITKALATALFETINDVRVLKGQGTITAEQFRTYVRSKL